MRALAGLLVAVALAGCGSVAFGPAYTEDELARMCLRRGGTWYADELRGGHCEFEGTGFM
ncbi:MAG TPA: hypothetical protein VFE48_05505 [Methylomirabilota bacterium]|nr:hypothetical protein [Methylomirabilota bacterium]